MRNEARRHAEKLRRRTAEKQPCPDREHSGQVPPAFESETAGPLDRPLVLKGPAYVIDGDSIVICKTQIRLFGIDAPELNHPYGIKAKWVLVSLCKGHKVTATVLEKDDFGRTVARCTLDDGRDLSAEMVRLGMAIDWPKFSGGEFSHLEGPDVRRKLWLADARQKGRMYVWKKFDEQQAARKRRN